MLHHTLILQDHFDFKLCTYHFSNFLIGLFMNFQEQKKDDSQPQIKSLMRLTAYDDDDEDDSQSDCPNFSIYSSETMDVARHSQQELSHICPLEPPPLPPSIPDDDDIIVGDVQACDLADIPEPTDPYVESLRKERQALSKIPPKKISNDSRGKITFKIENVKMKLHCNRLSNLYDEIDENIEMSIETEKKQGDESKDPVEPSKATEGAENLAKSEDDSKNLKEDDKVEETKADDMDIFPKDVDEEKEVPQEESNEADKDSEVENLTPPIVESLTPRTETYTPERICEDDDSSAKTEEKSAAEEPSALSDDDSQKRVEGFDEEQSRGKMSSTCEVDYESENFPLEKEKTGSDGVPCQQVAQTTWESDGAYTPCKDELPIKDMSPMMSGLEPITPTRDKSNDDLDGCRTPAGYAGLGTEAISETDEAMNFEDEVAAPSTKKTTKEKDVEEGEIMDEAMKVNWALLFIHW